VQAAIFKLATDSEGGRAMSENLIREYMAMIYDGNRVIIHTRDRRPETLTLDQFTTLLASMQQVEARLIARGYLEGENPVKAINDLAKEIGL
jgi:hypothetical protein